jgi:hypothetical protein
LIPPLPLVVSSSDPSYSQEIPLLDIPIRVSDDARDNEFCEGLSSKERGGLMANIEQHMQEFEDQENALGTTFHYDPSLSVSSTEDDSLVLLAPEPHTIYSWYKNLQMKRMIQGTYENMKVIPKPLKHHTLPLPPRTSPTHHTHHPVLRLQKQLRCPSQNFTHPQLHQDQTDTLVCIL